MKQLLLTKKFIHWHPSRTRTGERGHIMANKINKSEMDAIVRGGAIASLNLEELGTQIGTSTYAIPVETPEGVFYAKVAVTAAQRADTKAYPAFNLEDAVAKFEAECAEKAEKAAEREAAKAAKAAARAAKEASKAE